jgi:hypothetical protein
MTLPKANLEEFHCVVKAYRLARWANHAWGLLPDGAVSEVWNIAPSLKAFCDLLAGYGVARGWIAEGPVGYGVWRPEYRDGELVVTIGSHGQVSGRFRPGRTAILYEHGDRYAAGSILNGVVGANGYRAQPRDWARVARLLIIADEPTDLERDAIREALRNMVGDEASAQEFDKYFALSGPQILAGPEVIMG